MKQIKFNYTFFKGVCVIVLVFGLLFAVPSAMKLYKDNFVYTEKVMATSSSIDIKAETNEDTGKTYYTPIYYGTYHGKKVSFQSDQSLDQDYLTKDQLIKLNQPKTFWINPNDPKDYTDQKMGFDVQILIGVLLSLGSIRMIFVMRKLEKERIHDHKKSDVNEKREFGRKDFFLTFLWIVYLHGWRKPVRFLYQIV